MPSAMNNSLELRDGSEVEISRLFPKCRPRSTPNSPSNPPTTPIPTRGILTSSQSISYQLTNATLHSALDYSFEQNTNPVINAALNKSSHQNPNTITYSANSYPINSYSNIPLISTSTLSYDSSNYTPNDTAHQTIANNIKSINSSLLSHQNRNFNRVSVSDDNDNYESTAVNIEDSTPMQESISSNSSGSNSSSRMSVDTASSNCSPAAGGGVIQTTMGTTINNQGDVSVVSGYQETDNSRTSILDSSYEDMPPTQSRREFKLRDSRIEVAGGREVYSQSRSRMHRHRNNMISSHHASQFNNQPNNKQHQQQLVQMQQQYKKISSQVPKNSKGMIDSQQPLPMDASSASSSCSRTSRESGIPSDSPVVYEARFAGSSEVVFDDIGEWNGELTVHGMDDQTNASSTPTSGPDSESPDLSPSRITKIGNVPIADYEGSPRRYGPRSGNVRHSPRRGHSLRPRPGFPRRVSTVPQGENKYSEKRDIKEYDEKAYSNKTSDVMRNVNYNGSEMETSNSTVAPVISISTLTSVYGSPTIDTSVNLTTSVPTSAENETPAVDPELVYDYEVSETQKNSRNFTLSPDSTSCDSGEVESSEFSGGEGEGSIHSSRGGLGNAMPVLEDGLSSGEESDTGDSAPPVTKYPSQIDSYYHYQVQQRIQQQQKQMVIPDDPSLVEEAKEPPSEPPQLTLLQQQMNEKLKEQQQIIQQVQAEAKLHHQQMRLQEQQERLQQEKMKQELRQKELEEQARQEEQAMSIEESSLGPKMGTVYSKPISQANLQGDTNQIPLTIASMTSERRTESVSDQQKRLMEIQQQHQSNLMLLEEQKQQHQQLQQQHQQNQQQRAMQHQIDQNIYYHQPQNNVAHNTFVSDDNSLSIPTKPRRNSGYLDTLKEDDHLPDENGNSPEEDSHHNWYNGKESSRLQKEQAQNHYQQQRGRSFEDKLCRGELPYNSPARIDKYDFIPGTVNGSHTDVPDSSQRMLDCSEAMTSNNYNAVNSLITNTTVPLSSPIATSSPHILPSSLANGSISCENSPHTSFDQRNSASHMNVPQSMYSGSNLQQLHHVDSYNHQQASDHHHLHHSLIDYQNIPGQQNQSIPNGDVKSLSSSTLNLMKKQITEIEREIAMRKPDVAQRYPHDEENGAGNNQLDLQLLDPLNEKMGEPPPPPAPHPHRGNNSGGNIENGSLPQHSGHRNSVLQSPHYTNASDGGSSGPMLLSALGGLASPGQVPGSPSGDLHTNSNGTAAQNRETVAAAIADIKQAIRRTKNLPTKGAPVERCAPNGNVHEKPENNPVWVPRCSRRDHLPNNDGPVPLSPSSPSPGQGHTRPQDSVSAPPPTAGPTNSSRVDHRQEEEDGDTDQETDRLLGQQRSDDPGYGAPEKVWRRSKSRTIIPRSSNNLSSIINNSTSSSNISPVNSIDSAKNLVVSPSPPTLVTESTTSTTISSQQLASSQTSTNSSSSSLSNNLNGVATTSCDSSVSTSDVTTNGLSKSPIPLNTNGEGSITSPSTPIGQRGSQDETSSPIMVQNESHPESETPLSTTPEVSTAVTKPKMKKEKDSTKKKGRSKEVLIEGVLFRARYLGSTQLVSEGQPTKTTRMMQAEEAVTRIKTLAPDGETQPNTEVDLFISTEKIMVLNTDLKEIMMDHALRTISYIADIGDLVVLMARRRMLPTDDPNTLQKAPKMICHVFESDEAQFIAQSIGQAFQVAYLEFLKANGIEDHSFVKEMDYQEVLNSQEIFGDELQMFAKKELQKEVVVPKMKSEILGVVVVESGWGSMVPTVVIANLSPIGAAAKCGQLNIGDQIIAINGVSLVGLPLSTCQNYIKNTKYNTAVKLTVVPCPPVVEVKIRRPDTKYQLGFSVQNGVICSLLRGGIAERGGVRVGHRIIDINSQSVVAVPHEKIVNLLATSVGEIRMKTMPTSIFRLLTGQETPQYI